MQTITFPDEAAAKVAIRSGATIDLTVCPSPENFPMDGDVVIIEDRQAAWVVVGIDLLAPSNEATAKHRPARMEAKSYNDSRAFERAQRKEIETKNALRDEIAKAIGPRCTRNENGAILVDGQMFYNYTISQDRDHTSMHYGSTPSGKYSITIGSSNYGRGSDKKRYPQRKDGGHNMVDIAKHVLRIADRDLETRAAAHRRLSHTEIVKAVAEKLTFIRPFYVNASSNPDKPCAVKVTIEENMTVDDLESLDMLLAGWRASRAAN